MTRRTPKERQAEAVRRLQRRYTGPWRTVEFGPISWRYRQKPRTEFLAFSVATQHLWHVIRNAMLPVVRWLAHRLPPS